MVFRSLTKDDIRQIVDVQLRLLRPRLEEHNLKLEVTDAAKDKLGEEGFDQQFGARPLKRTIQRNIEDPLSEGVLSGEFKDNSSIIADVIDGSVKLVPQEGSENEAKPEEVAAPV